jgi:hypothetical protein
MPSAGREAHWVNSQDLSRYLTSTENSRFSRYVTRCHVGCCGHVFQDRNMVRGSFLLLPFSIMRLNRDSKLAPTLPGLLSGGTVHCPSNKEDAFAGEIFPHLPVWSHRSRKSCLLTPTGHHQASTFMSHTTATESRVGSGTVPFHSDSEIQ